MRMRASGMCKMFVSTLIAFSQMSEFLFEKYSAMALAGKNSTTGIEEGISDSFSYFLDSLFLGILIWIVSMFALSTIEYCLNKLFQKMGIK